MHEPQLPDASHGLRIQSELDGDCVVVKLIGEADVASESSMRDSLLSLLNTTTGSIVVVDLSGLRFIDSRGLSALIAGHRRAEQLERRYALAAPQPSVRKVIGIAALDKLVPVHDSVAAALA